MSLAPRLPLRRWLAGNVVVVAAVLGATASVLFGGWLQQDASRSRDSQVTLASVARDVQALFAEPWIPARYRGPNDVNVRRMMRAGRNQIDAQISQLQRDAPMSELATLRPPLEHLYGVLEQMRRAAQTKDIALGNRLTIPATSDRIRIEKLLERAGDRYKDRASTALGRSTLGGAITIALLLVGFTTFYYRSRRLLRRSRDEALTDPLTGLNNRRKLFRDLDSMREAEGGGWIALLDLNGFKACNDTLGHNAGDALLVRLAHRLRKALPGKAEAYRIGGDEFAVLASTSVDQDEALVAIRAAMREESDLVHVSTAVGFAPFDDDNRNPDEVLRIADERMYLDKAGSSSPHRARPGFRLAARWS